MKKKNKTRPKIYCRHISNKEYGCIVKNTAVCTVDVLFFDSKLENTILFKRKNKPASGIYFSLGGRLWKNEDLLDCAVRKVRQEAGLKITKEGLFFGGVSSEFFDDSIFSGVAAHCVNIFYGYILEKGKNQEIVLDSQHADCRWFSVGDVKIHPYVRKKINQLLVNYAQSNKR